MRTATDTTKSSSDDDSSDGAKEYRSQIFENQSERIIFIVELVGVVLFLIFTYLNMYVESIPQMASYHASKYVQHKLVESTWQECFNSATNPLLAALYPLENEKTCRQLSFDSIFETSQILDWAEGVWFFELGITDTPSDREFFSSMNTSNYQAVGNVNASIYTLTGTQILGEMLIWQVRFYYVPPSYQWVCGKYSNTTTLENNNNNTSNNRYETQTTVRIWTIPAQRLSEVATRLVPQMRYVGPTKRVCFPNFPHPILRSIEITTVMVS